jgi:CHASE3 domain sensor protein
VSASKEAVVIFKESGSLTETVRRLYAHERTPDAYRMSSRQRSYILTNFDEFVSIHCEEMQRLVDDMLADLRAKGAAAGNPMSEGELAEAEKSARIRVATHFAKKWCELRGVT